MSIGNRQQDEKNGYKVRLEISKDSKSVFSNSGVNQNWLLKLVEMRDWIMSRSISCKTIMNKLIDIYKKPWSGKNGFKNQRN